MMELLQPLDCPEDALERAAVLWQRVLADCEELPMDQAIREELDAFVAR